MNYVLIVFIMVVQIQAANYNEMAIEDDGSCSNPGCTDPAADNYNANANPDDGNVRIVMLLKYFCWNSK